MDEYVKLRELYQHMMDVRKDSLEQIQALQSVLSEGIWFPQELQQMVLQDLQSLRQSQAELCQALEKVHIAAVDKADDLWQHIEQWHQEQEHREAMQAILKKLDKIFTVRYQGQEDVVKQRFQQMQAEVKTLQTLSLTFEDLSERAEKYIRFLEAVHTEDTVDRSLAKYIKDQFGSEICFACIYHDFVVEAIMNHEHARELDHAIREKIVSVQTTSMAKNVDEVIPKTLEPATDTLPEYITCIQQKVLRSKLKNAKTFSHEMDDFAHQTNGIAVYWLKILCTYGFAIEGMESRLSKRLASDKKQRGAEKFDEIIAVVRNRLLEWGIVVRYQWENTIFYRLTDSCFGVLQKDSVRKRLGIRSFVKIPDWAGFSRLYLMETFLLCLLDGSPYDYAFFKEKESAFWGVSLFAKTRETNFTDMSPLLMICPMFLSPKLAKESAEFDNVIATKLIFVYSFEEAKPYLNCLGDKNVYVTLFQPDIKKMSLFAADQTPVDKDVFFSAVAQNNKSDIDDYLNPNAEKTGMIFLNENVQTPPPDFDSSETEEKVTQDDDTQVAEKEAAILAAEVVSDSTLSETDDVVDIQKEAACDKTISGVDLSTSLKKIYQLFQQDYQAEGSLKLHLLARNTQDMPGLNTLCDEISYILDDPLYSQYNQQDGFMFWDSMISLPNIDMGQSRDYFNAAAMVRAFFAPREPKGYLLGKTWSRINEESNNAFSSLPSLKKLAALCKQFSDTHELSMAEGLQHKDGDNPAIDLETARKNVDEQCKALADDGRKPSPHPRLRGLRHQLYGGQGAFIRYFKEYNTIDCQELIRFCNVFLNDPLEKQMSCTLISETLINEEAVTDYLNKVWFSIEVGENKREGFLGKDQRHQVQLLKRSIIILCRYVTARILNEKQTKTKNLPSQAIDQFCEKAMLLIAQAAEDLKQENANGVMESLSHCVLSMLLRDLTLRFQNHKSEQPYYAPLLKSGYLELNQDFLPDLTCNYDGEGVLSDSLEKHILLMETNKASISWQDAYNQAARSYNLGIAEQIADLDNTVKKIGKWDTVCQNGLQYAISDTESYRSNVELAANYGKIIGKDRMEYYFAVADAARSHFKETKNFALYKELLQRCLKRIDEEAEPRRQSVQQEFNQFKEQIQHQEKEEDVDLSWLDQIQDWLNHGNLTIVEDYLHRCANKSIPEMKGILNYKNDFSLKTFSRFMEEYQDYYKLCNHNKGLSLSLIYEQKPEIKRRKNNDRLNRKEKDAADLMKEWTTVCSQTKKPIAPLLEGLGYPDAMDQQVIRAASNCTWYDVKFKKDSSARMGYNHTFALFGSGVYRNGLYLIVFSGNHEPQSIINEIKARVSKEKGTLFLLDSALTLSERCELAKLMKLTPDVQNVIVIDRVMALYLTKFEKVDRNDNLMALALPFAYVQPFISEATIPPEMFIGRTQELAAIQDVKGPVFVYGGRQLGKSALLRQTRYLVHHPEQQSYAVYLDIKTKKCTDVLKDTCAELERAGVLNKHVRTWDDFGNEMKNLLTNGKKKINKLMILYDEADNFLVAAAEEKNRPIEVLKDIRDYAEGRFKFVFAGLHNVIRFDRKQLGGNTVFAQLGHIVIRPFEYLEANELLLKPLSYLGFEIKNQDIISTILAQTNYFPGLIQYYGKKLVESVRSKYKSQIFNAMNTPPYPLDEGYLKDLLKDEGFRRKIDDMFMITLALDKDNYYDIIALAVAYLYQYNDQQVVPVSVDDVKAVCADYGIHKVADMCDEQVQALIDEMIDLNILHKDETGKSYVFNRYNFYMMMGDWDDVERKMKEYGQP